MARRRKQHNYKKHPFSWRSKARLENILSVVLLLAAAAIIVYTMRN